MDNNTKRRHFIVVNFCNPLMDNINLRNIINNKDITSLFPQINDASYKTPIVYFKYSPTIRSKITNYRECILKGEKPTQCDCENY